VTQLLKTSRVPVPGKHQHPLEPKHHQSRDQSQIPDQGIGGTPRIPIPPTQAKSTEQPRARISERRDRRAYPWQRRRRETRWRTAAGCGCGPSHRCPRRDQRRDPWPRRWRQGARRGKTRASSPQPSAWSSSSPARPLNLISARVRSPRSPSLTGKRETRERERWEGTRGWRKIFAGSGYVGLTS
jgi:hypothetical protein